MFVDRQQKNPGHLLAGVVLFIHYAFAAINHLLFSSGLWPLS